jgi:hypothetical protein
MPLLGWGLLPAPLCMWHISCSTPNTFAGNERVVRYRRPRGSENKVFRALRTCLRNATGVYSGYLISGMAGGRAEKSSALVRGGRAQTKVFPRWRPRQPWLPRLHRLFAILALLYSEVCPPPELVGFKPKAHIRQSAAASSQVRDKRIAPWVLPALTFAASILFGKAVRTMGLVCRANINMGYCYAVWLQICRSSTRHAFTESVAREVQSTLSIQRSRGKTRQCQPFSV